MIKIELIPWIIRGLSARTFQVYVFISYSNNLSQLIEVKRRLNSIQTKGVYFIENRSKAIKRLGWKEFDKGVYYKEVV